MPDDDRLKTIRQTARYLRVRDSDVRAWVRSGELQTVDLGNGSTSKVRVTPEALASFLASRTITKPSPQRSTKRPAALSQKKWF
jgi:excisionase family DNA binding protein